MLTKTVAVNLHQKAHQVFFPGSGMLIVHSEEEFMAAQDMDLSQRFYLSTIVSPHNTTGAEGKADSTQLGYGITIETSSSLPSTSIKHEILRIPVSVSSLSGQELVEQILSLQKLQKVIILALRLPETSLQEYQQCLNRTPAVFLDAMAIEITLPSTVDDPSALLGVLTRTVPVSIGALIIHDWLQIKHSIVRELFFLKKMQVPWLIQFSTTSIQNIKALALQSMGV